MSVREAIARNRIVPVGVFPDDASAIKVSDLLQRNSIDLVEVTMRTDTALSSIVKICGAFSGMIVGAGSILSEEELVRAVDAGARFAVSPHLDVRLVKRARELGVVYVPGVSTPSELGAALSEGSDIIKIFPAHNLGGAAYINAVR